MKNMDGFLKIISIKASMFIGLSGRLKATFPNIIPVLIPLVVDQKIPPPLELQGLLAETVVFFS